MGPNSVQASEAFFSQMVSVHVDFKLLSAVKTCIIFDIFALTILNEVNSRECTGIYVI